MQRFTRPQALESTVTKRPTGHGNLYVIVCKHPETGLPIEVFAKLGKAGGCESAHLEALTRVISVALQYGVPLEDLVHTLRQVTCHPYMIGNDELANTSPADAIAHVLEKPAIAIILEKPNDTSS